jgi:UDP-glucose 4-epimerase
MDRCPPCVVLRSFNAFGPGQTEDSVMRTIIVQALAAEAAGRNAIVLGAADHARDFIFAEDVAGGFIAAAAAPSATGGSCGALESVDLGTGRATTVRDVVAAAGRVLGRQFTIEQDPARLRPAGTDPAVLVADAVRAQKVLGWSATTSLDDGLRRTFEWFRARPQLWR